MKLSDLMTAAQAMEIINYCESLKKRIENLENENRALRAWQTWGPIYETVKMYTNDEENY